MKLEWESSSNWSVVTLFILERVKIIQKNKTYLNGNLDCVCAQWHRKLQESQPSKIQPFSISQLCSSRQHEELWSWTGPTDPLLSKPELTVEPLDWESPEKQLKNFFLLSDLRGQVEECYTDTWGEGWEERDEQKWNGSYLWRNWNIFEQIKSQ